MKKTSHYNTLSKATFYTYASVFLFGCTPHVSIQKALNVSKANQFASIKFTVTKQGTYRFSFLFARSDNPNELSHQTTLWGTINQAGTPIFTQLRVFSDNTLIFDERLITRGTRGAHSIFFEKRWRYSDVRPIQTLYLKPGNYTAEFKTLSDAPLFATTQSYVEVSYYNPKH